MCVIITLLGSPVEPAVMQMPQHPKTSWGATLSRYRVEIEKIRKKAAIQVRKAQAAAEKAFEDIVTWFVEGKADDLQDSEVWPALASEVREFAYDGHEY